MNKRHKATCNSGLAKYPDGVPAGICADRNCDCGIEADVSEIAESSCLSALSSISTLPLNSDETCHKARSS
jgi:hypothetical protein